MASGTRVSNNIYLKESFHYRSDQIEEKKIEKTN